MAKETNNKVTSYPCRPADLAKELGIDAKVLRNYLRKEHTRAAEAKNTSWSIDAKVAAAARKAFAPNKAGSAKA